MFDVKEAKRRLEKYRAVRDGVKSHDSHAANRKIAAWNAAAEYLMEHAGELIVKAEAAAATKGGE